MANANYQKGRRREWACQKTLEAAGYHTLRSAGSHSLFDVVGYNDAHVRFIQIKCDRDATPTEREAIESVAVPANTTKEIWLYKTGTREAVKHWVIK